ncbi:serine hydrolase [Allosphingosinicella sp.]|uniref:serine hydrolase n=1 Tax=Allosphingosinicella sp. TaxID=2823234 RepID=UPI002F0C0076
MSAAGRWLAWLLVLLWPASAIAAEPSPALAARATELVAVLNGETARDRFFSPDFLIQVPARGFGEIAAQLRTSYGRAKSVERVEAGGANSGIVVMWFERAVVRFRMAVGPKPPHLVEGLIVTGAESSAVDVASVFGEMVKLPGEVSLSAARLEEAGPADFLTEKAERPLAIGSAFKLFVLAELVRSVKAGERKWSDVVPLGRPSLPSGLVQDWPKGSPVTLHSLAALMISRSDNSATDTLLEVLGREKVERLLPALGVRAPERNRPFLSTRDAFALKLGDPALLERWKAADEAGRRALLPQLERVEASTLDPSRRGGRPAEVAAVEWFASPADLVRTLDWLRRSGDRTALELLAINPGLGPGLAKEFDYFGFKGGSESGVLNLSFLLKTRSGRWMAVSATWNDPAAPLDEPRFVALMSRLVTLLR